MLALENKRLLLETDHSLQKDAIAKIAQQFQTRQVQTKQHHPLYINTILAWSQIKISDRNACKENMAIPAFYMSCSASLIQVKY